MLAVHRADGCANGSRRQSSASPPGAPVPVVMQQELWLRTRCKVLSSLKPISTMRSSSRSFTETGAELRTAISTLPASNSTTDVVSVKCSSEMQPQSTDGVKSQVIVSSAVSQNQPKSVVSSTTVNPVKASRTHQELHRELLLAYKKGLVVCSRPELQVVLERRRREQAEKEEGEQGRSPLEKVLLKRHQIHQEKEKQQEKTKDDPQLLEILKVRQNLRKIQSTLYKTSTS
ncbi:hypothetical protein GN956_G20133 [Arapaima gigas]